MMLVGFLSILLLHVCLAMRQDGPCPDITPMANFDISKGTSPWSSRTKFETAAGDLNYKCGQNDFTIQPDKSVTTAFKATSLKNANEPILQETTLNPVAGQPGVFDVVHKKHYESLGELNNAPVKRFYVLDTDYGNYLVGASCLSDGSTWHVAVATASFKKETPESLEKAKNAITSAGFPASSIKTVDQSGCA